MLRIGYTKKPHGLKGEIKLEVEDRFVDAITETEVLFLNIKGKQTPFFIEDVRIGNAIIAKLEDINSPEEAAALGSKEIYIDEAQLEPAVREAIFNPEDPVNWEGYRVMDTEKGDLGQIEQVLEYPMQFMGFVMYRDKQVMIPLHPDLIILLDTEQKVLHMSLPEGLLDL